MPARLTGLVVLAAALWLHGCDECPSNQHVVHITQPDEALAHWLAACPRSAGFDAGAAVFPRAGNDAGPTDPCAEVCRRIYEIAVESPAPERLRACSVSRDRDGGAVVTVRFEALCQ